MARREFSADEKIRFVEKWIKQRAAGGRQDQFCADAGIAPRRLREWMSLYGPVEQPVVEVRRIVEAAAAEFNQLLHRLESQFAIVDGQELGDQHTVENPPTQTSASDTSFLSASTSPSAASSHRPDERLHEYWDLDRHGD